MSDLKYIFEAEYADGTVITQPDDNASRIHQMDENDYQPSAFRDVLDHAEKADLQRFSLIGEGHRYSVDLIDGHFEIDGLPFIAHPQNLRVWSTKENPLRPIYYREMKRNSDFKVRVGEDGGSEIIEQVDHEAMVARYFVGWQTNLENGENVQYVIGFE